MDDRLKQRLVGAAVLVALAVIFLPMLLDGQPRQVERTVRLGLPERPVFEGEGEVIPLLDEPQASTPEKPPEKTIDLLQPETGGNPLKAPTKTATETAISLAGDKPAPQAAHPEATPEKHEQTAEPVSIPPDTPADTPVATADDPANIPAPASTPPVETPAPVAAPAEPAPVASTEPVATAAGGQQPVVTSGWWVQLGVFSRQQNARRLVARGQQAGFPCRLEAIRTGQRSLQRVQCGPWPDAATARQQKKAILAELKLKEGRVFQAGSESPEQTARTDVAPALQGWAVQVGSFKARKNADQLTSRLRKLDFPAYVEPLETSAQTRYRVRVGPYADRAQAKQVQQRLARKAGLGQGMLVKSP